MLYEIVWYDVGSIYIYMKFAVLSHDGSISHAAVLILCLKLAKSLYKFKCGPNYLFFKACNQESGNDAWTPPIGWNGTCPVLYWSFDNMGDLIINGQNDDVTNAIS